MSMQSRLRPMGRSRSLRICAFGIAVLLAGSVSGQGRLQQVREKVRSDDRGSSRDRPIYTEEDEAMEGFFTALFRPFCEPVFHLGVRSVTAPYWAPAAVLDDDLKSAGWFATYPYAPPTAGYLVPSNVRDQVALPGSMRTRIEYGNDFSGLARIGTNLIWETPMRVGVDATLDYNSEALTGSARDTLWTGDANIVYRFAQSERVVMRSGVGFNWMADHQRTDVGFNFTYGGDWFLQKPWVLSASMDLGWIGDAALYHGRATIGRNFHHWELYAGYEFRSIGGVPINGMISGIRIWY